jgi:zinc protease
MQITKHTLQNGMTVLLNENRSAPVISYNILVYAGSAIETDEEAGMCHVIEHMIFKGTPSRPVGTIARDIEAAGGEVNAYTSFDQTVFYINMASRFSDKGLEILADAVQNPLFDAAELERELEVICEEIRRGKDNPSHCISEDLFKHAYTAHPYGRPIIGYFETVKSFNREKILQFYRRHYSPDNITCVVVGDFNPEEMLEKIARAFSSPKIIKESAPGDNRTMESEPPHLELIVNTATMDIQSTHFMLGFHIPDIVHDDIAALDILSHTLAGADSSRLEQIVKEKKRLVHSIYSYAFTPKYPGLFIIGGMTQPEKMLKTLDAIWEEIQKIGAEPVSADELNRAKVNIRASEVYERETVGGQAAKLAYFLATAGNHEFEKRYFQMLNDITADEVRAAALKYLSLANCTVEILSPKNEAVHPTSKAIIAACSESKVSSPLIRQKHREPVVRTIPNGIRLIIHENHSLPIVSIYGAMKGGSLHETPNTNGISFLTSRTLTKGTLKRNAVEIAKKIESIAGMIDGFTGRNSIGLRTEFLSDKLHDGLGLFAEVLCEPSFDDKEVEKERSQQLESIQNQEDNLSAMAFINFLKKLYGSHPYGLRLIGEKSSVKKLTPLALRKFWHDRLNPSELVLSVVGDVSPSEVTKLVTDWIRLKKKKAVKYKKTAIEKHDKPIYVENFKKGKEQSHIVLGFMGTILDSPDHYKLSVLNNILSGQGGRLFVTLRDKMSLAYSVSSGVQSGIEQGYFSVYIGTDAAKTETAINGIKKELELIRTEMVSTEELERAQQYMVGTFELDHQRSNALASSYTFNELYGLGINEIKKYPQKVMKVTREDVLATARKYIDFNSCVLSVIKPER